MSEEEHGSCKCNYSKTPCSNWLYSSTSKTAKRCFTCRAGVHLHSMQGVWDEAPDADIGDVLGSEDDGEEPPEQGDL